MREERVTEEREKRVRGDQKVSEERINSTNRRRYKIKYERVFVYCTWRNPPTRMISL